MINPSFLNIQRENWRSQITYISRKDNNTVTTNIVAYNALRHYGLQPVITSKHQYDRCFIFDSGQKVVRARKL